MNFRSNAMMEIVSYLQFEKELNYYNFLLKLDFEDEFQTRLRKNLGGYKHVFIGTYDLAHQNEKLQDFQQKVSGLKEDFPERLNFSYFFLQDSDLTRKEQFQNNYGRCPEVRNQV